MTHVLIAVCLQFATWLTTGDMLAGAAAGMWFFVGREYAQAEYRLIEHYYGGRRANMPVLAPLREIRAWDRKSVLDFALPSTVVVAIYFATLNWRVP